MNCLSVFDHFMGLALKGLTYDKLVRLTVNSFQIFEFHAIIFQTRLNKSVIYIRMPRISHKQYRLMLFYFKTYYIPSVFINIFKACVRYFLSNFYFDQIIALQKL